MTKKTTNEGDAEGQDAESGSLIAPENVVKPTDSMIASVQADTEDLIVHGEQQQRHAVKTETHTSASEQIAQWVSKHRERQRAKANEKSMAQTETSSSEPVNALVPLREQTGALIGLTLDSLSTTPLEDMRREKGLDRERREIYEELGEELDLREGMRMLDHWTRVNMHRHCRNMKQVNNLFPNLTATEVAMLPLLREVPETFLLYGTGFNSLEQKRVHFPSYGIDEGLEQNDFATVPMQLEMRVDGIAYGDDTTTLIGLDSDKELSPEDKEIVSYREEIRDLVQRLILLTIENPRIFELVREKTADALVVGVGLVKREALQLVRSRTQPETGDSTEEKSSAGTTGESKDLAVTTDAVQGATEVLRDALGALEVDDLQRVEDSEQEIADRLIEANITDSNDKKIGIQELVHLFGLLDQVPRCLLQVEPFVGRMQFYGNRVLFADTNGVIVEDCPLSAECSRTCSLLIFDEINASSSTNRTMHEIQEELTARAQTPIFKDFVDSKKDFATTAKATSYLEATGLQAFHDYGVSLQVVGGQDLEQLRHMGDAESRYVSGGTFARTWMKMGVDETDQMMSVLDRLGPELLQHVNVIRKTQSNRPTDEALTHGQIADVGYDPEDGTITFLEPQQFCYSDLTENARQERSFLMAVGVAQSIWENLDVNSKRRWNAFRNAVKQSGGAELREELQNVGSEAELFAVSVNAAFKEPVPGPHAENYVCQMGMDSEAADFCAHFACYVLCQNEFQTAAQENRVIQDKYTEVKKVIDGMCGVKRDFSDGSMPVAIMEGGLRHQIPEVPDVHNANALEEWMKEHKEREEDRRMEAHFADAEEHDPNDTMKSDDERDTDTVRELILEEICNCILTALDTSEEGFENLEELSKGIWDVMQSATRIEAAELVQEYLESSDLLDEFDPDAVQDIVHELQKEEILESE